MNLHICSVFYFGNFVVTIFCRFLVYFWIFHFKLIIFEYFLIQIGVNSHFIPILEEAAPQSKRLRRRWQNDLGCQRLPRNSIGYGIQELSLSSIAYGAQGITKRKVGRRS
jgi:hypothetical protein